MFRKDVAASQAQIPTGGKIVVPSSCGGRRAERRSVSWAVWLGGPASCQLIVRATARRYDLLCVNLLQNKEAAMLLSVATITVDSRVGVE